MTSCNCPNCSPPSREDLVHLSEAVDSELELFIESFADEVPMGLLIRVLARGVTRAALANASARELAITTLISGFEDAIREEKDER